VGLLTPRTLITRARATLVVAASRILVPCLSLLAFFLAARCLLASFLAACRPFLRCDTALLEIGPAAMAAISSFEAAHPAERSAFLVA
jgi:hypothetical protein